jgi:23S rRNA pseudouridine1911/1915/1917 synthase
MREPSLTDNELKSILGLFDFNENVKLIDQEVLTPDSFIYRLVSPKDNQQYILYQEDYVESAQGVQKVIEKWAGGKIKQFMTPKLKPTEGPNSFYRVVPDDWDNIAQIGAQNGIYYAFLAQIQNNNHQPNNRRLDVYLQHVYTSLSRASIQKLIKHGQVKVNSLVATKTGQIIDDEDQIEVDQSLMNQEVAEVNIPVIYEDDDCVVINKPLGVLSHSKGAFNPEGTVATWLKSRNSYEFETDSERNGIVHRLDRATSGVMICAKNAKALGHLQKQFQTRKAKKTYIARVSGHLKHKHAKIDMPIERNPKEPQRFRVGINGKSALTEYEVIKEFTNDSLIELRPTTGRTHQLRVHMKHLGNPIIGDKFYGGSTASRLYLHAYKLEITLPNSKRVTFEAPIPSEFQEEKL